MAIAFPPNVEETFSRARDDHAYRHQFIDKLPVPRFADFLGYDSEFGHPGRLARTQIEFPFGNHIWLHPPAFRAARQWDDMRSLIYDHEGMHAEQNAQNPAHTILQLTLAQIGLLNKRKVNAQREAPAYARQLANSERLSPEFKALVERNASDILQGFYIARRGLVWKLKQYPM